MTVPNIFANATTAIALVNLDQNFNTGITLGNTTVFLGNTTTTLGNVTLTGATVTASGGLTVPTSNVGAVNSGTYTPTLTNGANIDASTALTCQYMRVGNVVTVSGTVNIDPTAAATYTSLGMTLPIASNFANAYECGGVACSGLATVNIMGILADTTNKRAQFDGNFVSIINTAMRFSFTYQVI